MGPDFEYIVINSISPNGTVNVTVFAANTDGANSTFSNALAALIKDNPLTVLGQPASVIQATLAGQIYNLVLNETKDDLSCIIYQDLTQECSTNTKCLTYDGNPLCEPVRNNDDFGLWVGLGVGIPLFLLLSLLLCCCCCHFCVPVVKDDDTSTTISSRPEPLPIILPRYLPVRFNTVGRVGLYGSQFGDDVLEQPTQLNDSESTSSDYNVTVGFEMKRYKDDLPSSFSWDFMYPDIEYKKPQLGDTVF
ncbi:uncharacterized protein LOC128233995 [Mya arenaria]|uniref:uncharacterized protein LOC128233995 n=1 Tax=Mya arenaria TaxID=6604 RepID=UPI0022E78B5F|nr:uncharacterized protein LOC128233995 [Mya arenaria]